MPYLFDPSKLNYSGNKVAVRNLISVCNSYEEIYSNLRAQLTLARDSVNSWYSVWNGAFQRTDISINGFEPEHRQFLKQLGIILDLFYNNVNSILSTSCVPITMQYSKGTFTYFIPVDNNVFKRELLTLETISNLEINCTPEVIALQSSESNASTIDTLDLLINYSSLEDTVSNTIMFEQDVSGYFVSFVDASSCLFKYCDDISNSTITNCRIIDSSCGVNNFLLCDFVDSTLNDSTLNKSKLVNCNITTVTITDSVVIGHIITTSIGLNSAIKSCQWVDGGQFNNCYLSDISSFQYSTITNSDAVDVFFLDTSLSLCSVVNGNVYNCNVSKTYFKNVNFAYGSGSNYCNFNSCVVSSTSLINCALTGNNSKDTPDVGYQLLKGLVLETTLVNCDLSGMYIFNCDLSNCNIYNCRIINSGSRYIYGCSLIECEGTFNIINKSKLYPISMLNLVKLKPVVVPSENIEYIDNMFRTLRLKYLVGRLNNIGCYCNTSQTYDYVNKISDSNCMVGGRYFYKIGDFSTEILSVNLTDKTIGDIFKIVVGTGSLCTSKHVSIPQPLSPTDEADIYELNATPIIESFTRLMDEINFSSGLLEDSRNLFNALL